MKKRRKAFYRNLPKRAGAIVLSAAMVMSGLQYGTLAVNAEEASGGWKKDIIAAMDAADLGMEASDAYANALQTMENALNGLEPSVTVDNLRVVSVGEHDVTLQWNVPEDISKLVGYNVYWADKNLDTTKFQLLGPDGKLAERMSGDLDENGKKNPAPEMTLTAKETAGKDVIEFKADFSTFKNNYFKVAIVTEDGVGTKSVAVESPTAVEYQAILDTLGRGVIAVQKEDGVYLNWRILWDELDGGYFKDETGQGLTGVSFHVYRNGENIATVTNSTNYLDTEVTDGLTADMYRIVPVDQDGSEIAEKASGIYQILTEDSANKDTAYLEIGTFKPEEISIQETYGVTEVKTDGMKASDIITYTLNDASVMDADGDGEYEIIIKWNPRFTKDVSQWGYTGKQMLDCYKMDGTLLWRVDLGVNIRSGAHYTEFLAYDFEGDGRGELLLKTAPGSKVYQYEIGADGKNVMEDGYPKVKSVEYITIPEEDKASGVTNESSFVYSNADYREHLIEMFMDWGKWENYPESTRELGIKPYWPGNVVECFTVDPEWGDKSFYTGGQTSAALDISKMTVDEIKQYVPGYEEGDKLVIVATKSDARNNNAYLKTVLVEDVKDYAGNYDLSSVDKDVTGIGYTREEAELLTDYYMNHFGQTNGRHDINTFEGIILSGPEYLTLFDGKTGEELDTQKYHNGREDGGMIWGDYGWRAGVEPGNRVDRYNATIAYLDGETPSAVFGRGYYARTTMEVWNVKNGKLSFVDSIDSGAHPMENPFNDNGNYKDGCDPMNGKMSGQGQHYLTSADVNLDGRPEIINGGAIVGYDMNSEKLYLYSSGGDYIGGDESKGWKKHYHGDMMHITDIDPDRPGIELASCFEGGGGPWDWAVRTLYTNNVLFGQFSGKDTARFTIGDIRGDVRGIEIPAGNGYTADGKQVNLTASSSNHSLRWSADMTTQFIDGAEGKDIRIFGQGKDYVKAKGYTAGNSTKGNPALTADVFGDYRDEMIVRSMDSSSIRVYMNTEVSNRKNYTPMQNMQYRSHVAGQNSAYNMPSYVDYYYAADTDWEYVTIPNRKAQQAPGAVDNTQEASLFAMTGNAMMDAAFLGEEGAISGNVLVDAVNTDKAGMMPSPLAEYQFDFGNKSGAAPAPFKCMTNKQGYSAETGYGYLGDYAAITPDRANSGSAVLLEENPTDYELALANAVDDAARHETIEFAIDLPAGEYLVKVYVADNWNGASKGAVYSINDVEIGTFKYEKNAVKPIEEWAIPARVVLAEDGQIVVKGNKPGNLAYISAITVSEYVEKVDDYEGTKWDELKDSMSVLRAKLRLFADDSTPFDFDVSLVNKLTAVWDAVEAAKYMPLVDVNAGDQVYEDAVIQVEENKAMYTEATIAKLVEAMDAYMKAKEDLDIREELDDLQEMITYWLKGVDTQVETVYSGFFDFDLGTENYLTPGWTSVGQQENNPYLTSYEKERGYGFISVSPGRNRGHEDNLLTDWASNVVFALDLEAGTYTATVFTGEMNGTAKNVWHSFYTDYVPNSGSTNSGTGTGTKIAGSEEAVKAGKNSFVTTRYEFTLDEASQVVFEGNSYIQGLVVEEYIPATVEGYNVEQLKALIAEIGFENLNQDEYTVSSWESFEAAYEAAEALVKEEQVSVQLGEAAYKELESTWKRLVLRSGIIAYNIDFGPRKDSASGTPQLEMNGQSAAQFEAEAVAGAERPAFQLGHGDMLYADNVSNEGLHWGFTETVNDGNTANGGAYFRDWVYAKDSGSTPYTFKADLPTGDYFVFVYTGVKEGDANTTKLMFGNEVIKSTNPVTEEKDGKTVYVQQYNTGGQYAYENSLYYVRIEENEDALSTLPRLKMGTLSITAFDDTNASERTACINGLEIFPVRLDGAENPDTKQQVVIDGVEISDKTYDGKEAAVIGTPNITLGGIAVEEEVALEYAYTSTDEAGYQADTAPVNAGNYQLVISVADSDEKYQGSSAPIPFAIRKAPVTVGPEAVTVNLDEINMSGGNVSGGNAVVSGGNVSSGDAAAQMTKTYKIPEPVLGYTGLVEGETIEPVETPVFTHNAGDGMTAGVYTYTWVNSDVDFLRAENYELTRVPTGQLIISGGASYQTATVEGVQVEDSVYNGIPVEIAGIPTAVADGQDVTASVNGFAYQYTGIDGTVYDSAKAPVNAGTYQLVITIVDDVYEGSSAPVTFTIEKRPATVRPKSVTIQRGEEIPAFELSFEGLLGTDTLTVNGTPEFTTDAADTNKAGDYTITWTNMEDCAIGGNDNYTVTKAATGVLRISDGQSIVADKTLLSAYLQQLEQERLSADDYTEESWIAFKNARTTAYTVLATEGFTQAEVDTVLAQLKAAREALQKLSSGEDDNEDDDAADHNGNSAEDITETDRYGNSSQASDMWDLVDAKLKTENLKKEAYTENLVTGRNIVVPNKIIETLKNGNGTLAMHTGTGLTFSISSADIPEKVNVSSLNLTVNTAGIKAPKSLIDEKIQNAVYSRQISMAESSFDMNVNMHFSLGEDNAGKYANLYYFNRENGKLEYLGSYQINSEGQAMFGISAGADYLLTVTDERPNEKVVFMKGFDNAYVVQKGDTLSKIAAKHRTSVGQIAAVNPQINDINKICVGQVIRLR